jgi:hypothetical protein
MDQLGTRPESAGLLQALSFDWKGQEQICERNRAAASLPASTLADLNLVARAVV